MMTNYTRKGPRKQFQKYVTLNIKQKTYDDMVEVSNKNEETMSDLMRRAIQKEIERSK
jgi:hypothetical protein